MVTTGNNRNSASLSLSLAKPSPLFLSLSLSLLSLHLHSPFSIPLRLSSLLFSPLLSSSFSSSSYLFFSSSLPLSSPRSSLSLPPLSLSIRGIYHCPVRLIVLPRSWSVPGRKRLDRLFFFFPSFSFPISSSLSPSLSSINQVKFGSNLASSLSPSPSSLLAHGLAIPSSSAVPSTSSDHRSSDQLLLPLPSPISPV